MSSVASSFNFSGLEVMSTFAWNGGHNFDKQRVSILWLYTHLVFACLVIEDKDGLLHGPPDRAAAKSIDPCNTSFPFQSISGLKVFSSKHLTKLLILLHFSV